ncbi:MAG TPA: SelB C-terminal domain-containing protein, partial [Pyrinomonadaceae bacterium]|nr:SelB C-terminal domain-containing protein [Pyrinomonadaceae bacterium]
VQNGLVVITKKDLVETELLPLVEDEAQALVKGSFLEDAPVISVSSKTGEGLEELRSQLIEIADRVPPRSADFTTRLPIDRSFSMKGFGTVVTGTLISGQITEADELELLPPGVKVRVRGLQVHGAAVKQAHAGQRTAVNLAGIDTAQIERGMVLGQPGRLRPTQIVDVWIDVLPDVARPIRSRSRVRFHIGAAEVLGRVTVLDGGSEIPAGKGALAQIRLEAPVVALHDDRFILRSYSPADTVGGGKVLNPFAPKHRRKDISGSVQLLQMLQSAERATKFAAFVGIAGKHGVRLADLAAATGWTNEVLASVAGVTAKQEAVIESSGVFLSTESFAQLSGNVVAQLEQHHKREPLARGMLRETLREKLFGHSLPEVFGAVIGRLETSGDVVSEKDVIRLARHRVDLTDKDAELSAKIEKLYLDAGVESPTLDEAMTRAGVPAAQRAQARKILQLLLDNRKLVRVQGDMFMHPRVIETLTTKLQTYAAQHEPDRLIDVPAFKTLAGVSRKYAIPLLEYFDREQLTRRAGDKRVIRKI